MTPEEFEKLCQSIGDRVEDLSRVVGKGIASAGAAVGGATNNLQQYSQLQVQKAQERLISTRIKSSGPLKAGGIVMTACGGVGLASFGSSFLVALFGLNSLGFTFGEWASLTAICGIATAFFGWLTAAGIKRISLSSLLSAVKRIVGTREVYDISELAGRLQMNKKQLLSKLRKMIARGLLPQGRIDDEETYLILTDNAYSHYLESRKQARRKQREDAKRLHAQEQARLAERRHQALQSAELAALPPAAQDFVISGEDYIDQMRKLDEAIDDPEVSAKIVALCTVCSRIIGRVKEAPGVVDRLGRMSDYYLPTTIKLLTAYDDLESQPVQGDNITSSRQEIERTLDTLRTAFEKLLDETYADLSLDVSSDISVLQAVLAQEGLTGDDFKTN